MLARVSVRVKGGMGGGGERGKAVEPRGAIWHAVQMRHMIDMIC
jgi:hypothetical protein